MEMKRINENTIRVVLNSEDLSERGVTVLDLLNHNQQIEDFFYSILEEVDADHQFQDNDLVTFQVRPQQDGLELYITKMDPADIKNKASNATDQIPLDQDQITDLIKKELVSRDQPEASEKNNVSAGDEPEAAMENTEIDKSTYVVRIEDFEDLVSLARAVQDNLNVVSDFYRYQDNDYLLLTFIDDGTLTPNMIKDQMALVYEYGQKTNLTADVIFEHGKPLMKQAAFEMVRVYFK